MPEPQIDITPYYNGGMSWKQFLAASKENVTRMESLFSELEFDEETLSFFNNRTPLQVLAIAEDWCPDVAHNVALAARVCAEVPGMELSIACRDQHPDLMREYETDGKQRIPVIAFYDMTFRELARWSGRCRAADTWIFREVLKDTRDIMTLTGPARAEFDAEYDRRFRAQYALATIDEWQHLLEDQDY